MAAAAGESTAELLLRAAALVPLTHYALIALALSSAFLYRFLELHLLGDLLRGLRGGRVALTFHPASHVYHRVASKCRSLHGRYLATPWLASPHLQTLFLSISGRPPSFTYRRQLYTVRDGGTIALDWLLASDYEARDGSCDGIISEDDSTPLVVVIPGLTSDSTAAYVKHLVFSMASKGWNVVVSNHRGLGGMSITSDCFYNAGWTEDIGEVVNYLHQKYPEAPLFTVGTSIGANILVKYLGEEGQSTPVAGAVSICSPWDLLVTNRFISRKLVQRCYDRALAIGLKGYAKLHQPVFARLANWESIRTSRSIREFDHHATCVVAKYEIDENVYREIINHRSLRHPNIIQFIEVILTPTHLAIVMEYAAGGELFDRIVDRGRFSEDEARYFFQQLICGVSYCHYMQICHRDLKLENVLLDGSPAPRLKICDFGYSKSSVLHSRPKSAVGTPAYIAPEVLSRREYDGKKAKAVQCRAEVNLADVWSCGVTLYVMLVGAYPFEDQDDPRNIKKTIQRIAAIDYKIPDHVHISADCRQLISLIFVSNPMRRITMKEIKSHPWFLKNLPRELTEAAQSVYYRRDNSVPAFSDQTTQEIMKIVQEARRMPRSSRSCYDYSDEGSDAEEKKEEENEPEEKEEEEDECDKTVRDVRESGELNMSSLHI